MDWQDLWTAIALMLVLEGIAPFLSPSRWRQAMRAVVDGGDGVVRLGGLAAMIAGVLLLTLVR